MTLPSRFFDHIELADTPFNRVAFPSVGVAIDTADTALGRMFGVQAPESLLAPITKTSWAEPDKVIDRKAQLRPMLKTLHSVLSKKIEEGDLEKQLPSLLYGGMTL